MDSDSEDEYLGDGVPPPVLELIEDPTLHVCKIEHRRLGDDGCRRLFRWLETGIDWSYDEDPSAQRSNHGIRGDAPNKPGFPRSLSHLELNNVRMGDLGFGYLVDWLRSLLLQDQNRGVPGRPMLKTLILRSNKVKGSSQSAADFISVSSSLVSLGLSNNPLSPSFRQSFFSLLHGLSFLRLLDLSLTQLDATDIEGLSRYIGNTVTKCKLTHFIANANFMGFHGLNSVISSMELCWTLEKVDMFGNMTSQVPNHQPEEIERLAMEYMRFEEKLFSDFLVSADSVLNLTWGSGCGHALLDKKVKAILGRNIILKQRVKFQALELLKYSRTMLLKTAPRPLLTSEQTLSCSERRERLPASPSLHLSPSQQPPQSASISCLPTELQLSILSELAPILSFTQKIRIFEYAAERATLPKIRLCLPNSRRTSNPSSSNDRNADPTRLPFNKNIVRSTSNATNSHGTRPRNLGPPPEARLDSTPQVGSDNIASQRRNEIREWLELVQCDAYDLG